jgi:diadenosine tetraphosphate (Ap4A) HIT family hydrolase
MQVIELEPSEQEQLWKEVAAASEVVQLLYKPYKLNIAAIGNIVSQLHVHVTGRLTTDPSWPNPCYGAVAPKPLEPATIPGMLQQLREAFAVMPLH